MFARHAIVGNVKMFRASSQRKEKLPYPIGNPIHSFNASFIHKNFIAAIRRVLRRCDCYNNNNNNNNRMEIDSSE